MTVIISEVWDALKGVGVDDEKARRAAAAVADYRAGFNERLEAGFAEAERRDSALRQEMRDGFANVRQEMRDEFANVRQEMRGEFADVRQEMRDADALIRADIKLLKWMTGATFAGVVAILLRLYT